MGFHIDHCLEFRVTMMDYYSSSGMLAPRQYDEIYSSVQVKKKRFNSDTHWSLFLI